MSITIATLRSENEALKKELAAYEAQDVVGYASQETIDLFANGTFHNALVVRNKGTDSVTLIAKPTSTAHLDELLQSARDEGMERAAVIAAGYEPDFDGPIETAIRAEIKDKP